MSQGTKLGTLCILSPLMPHNDPINKLIQTAVKCLVQDYTVSGKTEIEHRKSGLTVRAFNHYAILPPTYN